MPVCSNGPAPRILLPLGLLLLLLTTTSTTTASVAPTGTLLDELAGYLQADRAQLQSESHGASWDSLINIQRQLEGKGFHRTLQLRVELAPGSSTTDGCALLLLQLLPSSVFADPYQLDDLTRGNGSKPGHGYSFKLLGPLDLELPAPACQDTALLLHIDSSALQQRRQSGSDLQLSIPLHAKYPQPYAAALQGWRWTLTGHVAAQLPWPHLLVDCRQQGGTLSLLPPPPALQPTQQGDFQACSSGSGSQHSDSGSTRGSQAEAVGTSSSSSAGACGADHLLWLVPAGNLDHRALVSWGTLLVTAAACLAVSWTAVASSALDLL